MSVERRRDKWAYRFNYAGETYFKSGFSKASEAEVAEEELRLRLSNTLTFSRMVDRRLSHVKAYCTHQYFTDTRAMLAQFKDWDGTPLSLITREMINDKILELREKLSANNVNRHIRGLRALFQLAVDEDLIPKNPTKGIKFLPVSKKPRVVPTAVDIKELLLKAEPEDQAFITIVWQTAARVNEINMLTWEDVNFDAGTVRLWTRKRKGGNLEPRLVSMLDDVRTALLFMYRIRVKESPWVFTSQAKMEKYPENPEKWHYGYRRKVMKRLTNRFMFHALRHSTASTLASIGVELTAIQKILGHSRPTTTDEYLSAMPWGVSMGMDKLGKHLQDSEDDQKHPNRNRGIGGPDWSRK